MADLIHLLPTAVACALATRWFFRAVHWRKRAESAEEELFMRKRLERIMGGDRRAR